MTFGAAALAFVTLLVIVDPLALAPVFAGLTRGMAPARVRRTAAVSAIAGVALIAGAGVAGHALERAFGAETALVHLAVAAALMVTGTLMLLGRGGIVAPGPARRDPALVPLAVPLIAGPGALGAMAMLAGKHAGEIGALLTIYGLLALVGALTFAAFRAADPIARRLGERGVRAVTGALGLVLIGVAARFAFEALRDYGVLTPGAAG